MSFYSFVLFFHITGALGIFVGLGIEWMIVHNFQRITTTSQALQLSSSFKVLPIVFSISGVLILFSGIYMVIENWGLNAWVITGFILYLFLSVFGSAVVAKKIVAITSKLDTEKETLSSSILSNIKSSLITQSLKIRATLALSIIFMMTIKPGWMITSISVLVALILGFLLTKIIN